MGDHHDIPSFEPDELGSSSAGIFIIAVAVFVAVSIVGVAVWLDYEVDLVRQRRDGRKLRRCWGLPSHPPCSGPAQWQRLQ